jgi:hypothetical protein
VSGAAAAQAPPLISYQLRLTDVAGDPLEGEYAIYFGLYASPEGPSTLWQESYDNPPLDIHEGLVSVLLGSRTPLPLDLFLEDTLYLGVRVAGDDELMPRRQIVSVPYAFRAEILGDHLPEDFLTGDELDMHIVDPNAHSGMIVDASQVVGMYREEQIPASIARTNALETHVDDRENPHQVTIPQAAGDTHHGDLLDTGVYTHDEVDAHIDTVGNPHGVQLSTLACPPETVDAGAYCIEVEERAAADWFDAAQTCQSLGRRLCRPSEWYAACEAADALGLNGMTGNREWVDNWLVVPVSTASETRVLAFGRLGCSDADVSRRPTSALAYRCCQ